MSLYTHMRQNQRTILEQPFWNKSYQLPHISSIITAEAFAIEKLLDDVIQNGTKNHYIIYIYTPLTLQKYIKLKKQNIIQAKLLRLSLVKEAKIWFIWVLSHSGIKENEEADKEAKRQLYKIV